MLIQTVAKPIGILLRPGQELFHLLVVEPRRRVSWTGPIPSDAIRARQLIKIASQALPIVLSSRLECVGRHETVDYGCAPQHVFDVGGAGSAVLLSITQAISRLLEVVHRLVRFSRRLCAATITLTPASANTAARATM